MAFALVQQIHLNNNILCVFPFFCDLLLLLCSALTAVEGEFYDKMIFLNVLLQFRILKDLFESNNLQDITDVQKLKSNLPLAVKLYYSERAAIINPPKSVKNAAIKVAKTILMY